MLVQGGAVSNVRGTVQNIQGNVSNYGGVVGNAYGQVLESFRFVLPAIFACIASSSRHHAQVISARRIDKTDVLTNSSTAGVQCHGCCEERWWSCSGSSLSFCHAHSLSVCLSVYRARARAHTHTLLFSRPLSLPPFSRADTDTRLRDSR